MDNKNINYIKKISDLELLIDQNKNDIKYLKNINQNLNKKNKELNHKINDIVNHKYENIIDIKNNFLNKVNNLCNSNNKIKNDIKEYEDYIDEIFSDKFNDINIIKKYNYKLYDNLDTYNKLIKNPINNFLEKILNLLISNNNVFSKNLIINTIINNIDEDFKNHKDINKLKIKYNNIISENFNVIKDSLKDKLNNKETNEIKKKLEEELSNILNKLDNLNFKNSEDLFDKFRKKNISLDREKNIIKIGNIEYEYLNKPNFKEIPGEGFILDDFDNLNFYYYKDKNLKNYNFSNDKWILIKENDLINFDHYYYIKVEENLNYLIIYNKTYDNINYDEFYNSKLLKKKYNFLKKKN